VVTIEHRAAEVAHAVREGQAVADHERRASELRALLLELQRIEDRLRPLAEVASLLGASEARARIQEAYARVVATLVTATTDAAAAATSEDGREMLESLRSAVDDLNIDVHARWAERRAELSVAHVPTALIAGLGKLEAFRAIARDLSREERVVRSMAGSEGLPTAVALGEAFLAQERLRIGLDALWEAVPADVREALELCFRNELRLVDVHPRFLEWIWENDLVDSFNVVPA
jgi:hypothetical protein